MELSGSFLSSFLSIQDRKTLIRSGLIISPHHVPVNIDSDVPLRLTEGKGASSVNYSHFQTSVKGFCPLFSFFPPCCFFQNAPNGALALPCEYSFSRVVDDHRTHKSRYVHCT